MYTTAHSTGNKQEELEAVVQQQSCDVVAIAVMWWDDSHSWSTALDGYKLFRRDRKGRRGEGVAPYIRKDFGAIDIETNDDEVECLRVRIKGKSNKADILLESVTVHTTRKKRWTAYFRSIWIIFQDHQPWFL
ncbi:hypothetical protein TURU_157360 [Turdus rufiventris]|nr:hypothetical protein TURU_157360 [Turdus rufiventris]